MQTKTLFRADNYHNNYGDLIGFFETIEEATDELQYKISAEKASGNFSQITEFTIPESEWKETQLWAEEVSEDLWPDNNRVRETILERMLEHWGEGNIVKNHYFVAK